MDVVTVKVNSDQHLYEIILKRLRQSIRATTGSALRRRLDKCLHCCDLLRAIDTYYLLVLQEGNEFCVSPFFLCLGSRLAAWRYGLVLFV
jgi:hypothetical protein